MDTRPRRRDFLRASIPRPADLDLLRLARPAMGTVFEILFPRRDRGHSREVHEALDEIRRLEGILSYFLETSRVYALNHGAHREEIPVEPELWEILELSMEIHRATGGAFDAAAGALWRCWGFHRRQGRIPDPEELESALAVSGMDQVELLPGRKVRFRREGLELNFGSIGKGFALDHALSILQNAGLDQVLLHAGHSSFRALGVPGAGHRGWKLGIRHPQSAESDLLRVCLNNYGMGTSGTSEQYFEIEGRRYGHILDPRTGQPADRYFSVTVLAPRAAEADALSTAFFNSSLEQIEAFCRRRPEVGAVIVEKPDGKPLYHVMGYAREWVEEVG